MNDDDKKFFGIVGDMLETLKLNFPRPAEAVYAAVHMLSYTAFLTKTDLEKVIDQVRKTHAHFVQNAAKKTTR